MSESNPSSLHATLNRLSMEPPVSYQLTGVSASLPIEWTASFKGKGGRGGVGLASAGWHEEGGGAGAAGGTCWCNFLALPRMDYDYDKSEESGTQAKVHDKFDKYSQTMRVTTCVARFVGVTPHVRVRMFMFIYVHACSHDPPSSRRHRRVHDVHGARQNSRIARGRQLQDSRVHGCCVIWCYASPGLSFR